MQRLKGQNNAASLFGLDAGPSDPQLRNLLDPAPPEQLAAPFWQVFEHLRAGAYLKVYPGHLGPWLCALDGTQYFGSEKVHCAQCSTRVVNDRTYYSHSLVAPLRVAPGANRLIALEPEFIRPQDGCDKQDCELRAAARWLARNAKRFAPGAVMFLGDALYCHQPFCALLAGYRCHFAFTCKPDSHLALYQELELLSKVGGVHELTEQQWHNGQPQIWHYRYATRVPLRADTKPLYVNWCEVTITEAVTGALLYHNAGPPTMRGMSRPCGRWSAPPAPAGRARTRTTRSSRTTATIWSITFGYGGQYRAMVLVMLIRLAFLVHTVLDLCDEQYRRVRCELATRQTFVSDLPALTRDLYFDDWQALITFMFSQLELDQASPSPPRRRSKYR